MVTASSIGMSDLRELVRSADPAVAVYLGPAGEAAHEPAARLSGILRDLSAQGADAASLQAVADHLAADAADRAVFARDGRVLLTHAAPGAFSHDRAAFGAPPWVVPLLAWLQANPAFVRVATDRSGAELITVAAGAADGTHQFFGCSTVEAIAPLVVEQLDLVRARVLVLSGDASAIRHITVYLRQAGRTPATTVVPDRRDGQARLSDRARIADLLDGYSPAETAERVTQVVAGLCRHGAAVAGTDQTLAALARGRLRSLVVVDDPADARTAWWGGGLLCSGFHPGGTLTGTPVCPGRLVDVAVRAALISRSEVRVLSPGEGAALPDGIGGLLR